MMFTKTPNISTSPCNALRKKFCTNLICTFFGEIDGVKSREDMRARNIHRHLHLQPNDDGVSVYLPTHGKQLPQQVLFMLS